jgi:hypothetical protein
MASAWLLLAGGTSVAAARDGVHYDPDSPSGQEYALPLDDARGQGGGGGGGDNSSGAVPFGQGVKPPSGPPGAPAVTQTPSTGGDSGSGGGSSNGGDRSGNGHGGGSGADSSGSAHPGSDRSLARPEITTASVQGSAAQTGLIIALAAVAAALLAAAVGRRLFRRDASV